MLACQLVGPLGDPWSAFAPIQQPEVEQGLLDLGSSFIIKFASNQCPARCCRVVKLVHISFTVLSVWMNHLEGHPPAEATSRVMQKEYQLPSSCWSIKPVLVPMMEIALGSPLVGQPPVWSTASISRTFEQSIWQAQRLHRRPQRL